jgi:hypothetical protein
MHSACATVCTGLLLAAFAMLVHDPASLPHCLWPLIASVCMSLQGDVKVRCEPGHVTVTSLLPPPCRPV